MTEEKAPRPKKLIWLDLETTGLDPHNAEVLEVFAAAAAYSDPFQPSPRILHAVLGGLADLDLDEFILKMHTESGLLCAAGQSPLRAAHVDFMLCQWADQFDGYELHLAGNSVHFDLGFCRVHFPNFAKRLSHRCFDVSAIMLFCSALGMPRREGRKAHRAEADVRESIETAAECAQWVQACGYGIPDALFPVAKV